MTDTDRSMLRCLAALLRGRVMPVEVQDEMAALIAYYNALKDA